jgi:hypothetical protein
MQRLFNLFVVVSLVCLIFWQRRTEESFAELTAKHNSVIEDVRGQVASCSDYITLLKFTSSMELPTHVSVNPGVYSRLPIVTPSLLISYIKAEKHGSGCFVHVSIGNPFCADLKNCEATIKVDIKGDEDAVDDRFARIERMINKEKITVKFNGVVKRSSWSDASFFIDNTDPNSILSIDVFSFYWGQIIL